MTFNRISVLLMLTALPVPGTTGQDSFGGDEAQVAEIVKQLKDPDWDTRMEAATALGMLGARAQSAIPNLLETLEDPVAPVRMKAIDAFMFMGRSAAQTVPRIIPCLDDPDELVRVSAVIALPRISSDRPATVALLKKALQDKVPKVRRRAAIELVALGAEPAATVPVLREGLQEPVPSDRLEAICTLALVVAPEERKTMVALAAGYLKDPDPEIRVEAVRRLSGVGAEAVPHLIGVLRTGTEPRRVQLAAIRALGRIGPEAAAALPVLDEMKRGQGLRAKLSETTIAAIQGKGQRVPEDHVDRVPPIASPHDTPTATPLPKTVPRSPPPGPGTTPPQ